MPGHGFRFKAANRAAEKGILTFAIPMPKFTTMIANMDESFLITKPWDRVKARL